MNPTAIESHLKLVLTQWMVIIAVAWIFGRLGKKLGQPLAVGEIFGGLLLGPSLLGAFWPEGMHWLFPAETQSSLQLLAKLGLILLLFQVGMEFDFGHLRARSLTVTMVSLMGIAAPVIGGLLIGPWLHRTFAPETPRFGFQLFVCIALSISALPIMGRILLEMKLERTALGALSISSAAIDDVIGWIFLAVATAVVTSGFDAVTLGGQVLGIAVFVIVLRYMVSPVLRHVWRKATAPAQEPTPHPIPLVGGGEGAGSAGEEAKGSRQTVMPPGFLALLLIVLFACALVTNHLGIFSIFGAFLLGVSLHEERSLVAAWREKFSGFVLVALVPIFFTNTGLQTEVGALTTSTAWMGCGLILFMAVAGKLGGCYFGARITGQSRRESACIAALMNTRALMGLVAINVGLELGLLTRELFTMFVIMALLTTVMTGPLLLLWLPPHLRPERVIVPGQPGMRQ